MVSAVILKRNNCCGDGRLKFKDFIDLAPTLKNHVHNLHPNTFSEN